MKLIYSYLEDFFSLFFPELCAACGNNLFRNENVICTNCIYHLPYTDFHTDGNNPTVRQLYGRVPFAESASFLNFRKGSKVQNLMHQLKYNNRPEVGIKLGEMYGNILKDTNGFKETDLIIPVPLHPKKFKKRGYNQSEYFAKGLSAAMAVPYSADFLKRPFYTESQTKKSRFVRFENMQNVFSCPNPEAIAGKHILLVDDILTTGATIEACALELLKSPDVKLSIATIAFTA